MTVLSESMFSALLYVKYSTFISIFLSFLSMYFKAETANQTSNSGPRKVSKENCEDIC